MAKKTFPCGHKGKGQYCHRCEQENRVDKMREQEKKEQVEWMNLFDSDSVNLRHLNNRKLVEKARDIINKIHGGTSYADFKGKRMQYNRNVISVPLNRDWRLIFFDENGCYICNKVMSHEEYNVKKPGEKL